MVEMGSEDNQVQAHPQHQNADTAEDKPAEEPPKGDPGTAGENTNSGASSGKPAADVAVEANTEGTSIQDNDNKENEKKIAEAVEQQAKDTNHMIEALIDAGGDSANKDEKQPGGSEEPTAPAVSVVTNEAQEVTSTKNDNPPRAAKSSRRASYQNSRNHPGSFQNYGLTYLPYKSNFEPSEDARRKADEFLKTLKL